MYNLKSMLNKLKNILKDIPTKFKKIKEIKKNTIFIIIAILAIIITGILIYAKSNPDFSFTSILGYSDKQIGENVIKYINDNQLASTPASLVSVSRVSGLVKVKIKIGTAEFDSYATKDGKFLFPQAFEMNPKKDDSNLDNNKTSGQPNAPVSKTDNPMLESFIVSRCPFGLQMQRAIVDAVKNMPALTKYIKIRYIGSVSGNTITAMHGEAEAKENLRQICIREEQPDKYWNYIGCDMKAAGMEKSCEQSTGVDSAKLNACIADINRGVAFAKKDFDLSNKYNISGSPTTILNGTLIDETNYGGRSSDGIKSIVCAGFNKEASFCSTKLNTTQAAASFSPTYEGAGSNNTDASCG